jgi:hypothetical protein
MKVKIHIELITDWGKSKTVEACEFFRPMTEFSAETVGLSLDDGKKLLHAVQQHVVESQTWELTEPYRICPTCLGLQRLKDYQVRRLDTVFGTVRFRSPRLISCDCEPPFFLEVAFCPFMLRLPERSTPELQRLQATLASEMSYRRAANILRRFLPASSNLNHATVQNRTLRLGERLQAAGYAPAEAATPSSKAPAKVTLTVDGGFVRSQATGGPPNFEIVTGRIVSPGDRPYVFAWVRSEAGSMQERLMSVLRAKTIAPEPQVSVITDGDTGVQHLHRLLAGRVRSILDWFHVSMRVRWLEQIVSGLDNHSETEYYTKRLLAEYLAKLRWHFWHANVKKAKDKLRHIIALCRCVIPETASFRTRLDHLDDRAYEFFYFLRSNKGTLIDYGKRYRAGKPVSTAMAESAVNQVINARMCKRQQMRWSPRGAHLLVQVRCAVINGDLASRLRRWSPLPPQSSIHIVVTEPAFA